jgi:hypothetical protein
MSTFDTPKLPEVKFNKNGYEIRTEILKQAQDLIGQEFSYKFNGWEMSQAKDKDGKLVTKVGMPEFPGVDKVLETAEKMYAFVNQNTPAKK